MVAAEVTVELPPLHKGRDGLGGQLTIQQHPARFKVIVCGRRWGKTTYGVWECIKCALEGGRTWWVAPTYKIAQEGWLVLRRIAMQLQGMAKVREGDHIVTFDSGGSVEIRSADIAGSNVGSGLNGLVIDEFPKCRETLWTEELRATLTDYKGWSTFIGTPKGRNWGYRLFRFAEKTPNWQSWRKFTVDNPYIDPAEVEEARQLLPPHVFKQEYEADFGASQLQVYSDFQPSIHGWKWEIPKFDFLYGGLDFGGTTIGSHKSAGGLAGYVSKTDTLLLLKHFEESGTNIAERQATWMATAEAELSILQKKLGIRSSRAVWRADKTQMGFIQALRSMGFQVLSSKGGKDSVMNGIELVQRRLKIREGDGKPRFYYDPALTVFADAMERYRYPEYREGETEVQAQNPLKVNDDTVDMFRYLVEGVDRSIVGDPQQMMKNQLVRVT